MAVASAIVTVISSNHGKRKICLIIETKERNEMKREIYGKGTEENKRREVRCLYIHIRVQFFLYWYEAAMK